MSRELSSGTRVVVDSEHASARVEDERILLDFGSRSYYGLNDVAGRVWELLQEPRDLAELRDRIVAEYDVAPEPCEADLREFLADLVDHGLVRVMS